MFISFMWFLGAVWASNVVVFDETQVFKTKEEVGVFFADWQAKKKGKTGFLDLKNCIKQLTEQDGEELLEHVTKDNPTKKDFCENWTDNKTHVLCGGLYTALREFLRLGEWWRFLCFWMCGLGGPILCAPFVSVSNDHI